MRRRRSGRLPLLLLLVLAVTTACSDSSKVGEGLEAGKAEEGSGCRLGECTTTTAAAGGTVTTSPPPPPPPPSSSTTTTRPHATTTKPPTTQPKVATFVIKVQNDSGSGGPFSPRVTTVRKGTIVRWTNTDSVARSVEADEGRFKSPSIPPGGSYDYTADTPGNFNYHDGTRPYAVGTLQVS